MAVTFESYERRIDQIKPVMEKYGIKDFEDSLKICTDKGFNPYEIVKGVQPICFENAAWAYTLGAAIAIKKGCKKASDAAKAIGEGLQAFCIPGSVADDRKVGLGHGNLASMLLSEDTKCFAFLAGHESFAAALGETIPLLMFSLVTFSATSLITPFTDVRSRYVSLNQKSLK